MGTAFARRLIETGHGVRIWNRTAARVAEAVEAGAERADFAGLAACDTILMSLVSAEASADVLRDLAAHGIAGRVIVEMSTLLPGSAEELATQAKEAGADFLHCPVGGTVAPALKGQLLGMAGGTPTAFERARPVLDALCRRVEYLGSAGAAARMKLAINLPLAIYWQTLGESLTLLRGAGLPHELAVSLIADSSAGPTVLRNRAQVVVDTLDGDDQPGTFDIAGLAKDLRLALALAAADGAALPLSKVSEQRYAAAMEAGLAGFDGASLTRLTVQG